MTILNQNTQNKILKKGLINFEWKCVKNGASHNHMVNNKINKHTYLSDLWSGAYVTRFVDKYEIMLRKTLRKGVKTTGATRGFAINNWTSSYMLIKVMYIDIVKVPLN